jgi:hypothetical protein
LNRKLKLLAVVVALAVFTLMATSPVNAVIYNVALKTGDNYTFQTTYYTNTTDTAAIADLIQQNNTQATSSITSVLGVFYNGTTYYPAVNLTKALGGDATFGYGSDYALIPANLTSTAIPDGNTTHTYNSVTINTVFGQREALHSTFIAQDNSSHDCYWDLYTGMLLTQNETYNAAPNVVVSENDTLVASSIIPSQATPTPTPVIPEFPSAIVAIMVLIIPAFAALSKKLSKN